VENGWDEALLLIGLM